MDQRLINVMLSLIRCEIDVNAELNESDIAFISENLEPLYKLSKVHDMAHIVASALFKLGILGDDEISQKFGKQQMIAIYRYENFNYESEQISRVFDEAEISFVLLKGSVIRPFYPQPWMRTSCDIDILIDPNDLNRAIELLRETLSYTVEDEKNYHDVSLFSPSGVHLELHFNIQENIDSLDSVLKDVWQYTELTKGSRYDFKKEFFVFHMYAHMAYHFLSGGCGIRALMDIWIMEHKMNAPYSCAKELLEKAGIYKFASEISNISNRCFSDNEVDVASDNVLNYICSGGVYGSKENHIAVEKSRNNSVFAYAWKRLFLPYSSMMIIYPVLKKAPYLLPFCWCARWIKAIFGGKSKKIKSEISCANQMSDEKVDEVKEIRSRLGL